MNCSGFVFFLSVSGLLANQTCVKVECSEYDEDNANTSSEASKILLFISCLVLRAQPYSMLNF